MVQNIFCDYNSTTPLDPRVLERMVEIYSMGCLNPSSIHFHGRRAKSLIDEARFTVKSFFGIADNKYDVVFTSGGTEANNLLLNSFLKSDKKIAVSAIEHSSIMQFYSDYSDGHIQLINVTQDGVVDLEHLRVLLCDGDLDIVSVMAVNNETGVIQPLRAIVEMCHAHGVLVHSDVVQACGKIPLDINIIPLDFATLSAHKIGGPIGVGALLFTEEYFDILHPLIIGGGQERGVRSGTQNVAGICGFQVALSVLDTARFNARTFELRSYLESELLAIPGLRFFGDAAERIANTSMFAIPKIASHKQLIALDIAGVSVSAGAACSSGKVRASHVLKAMSIDDELAKCAIRISFGMNNSLSDVEKIVQILIKLNNNVKSHV